MFHKYKKGFISLFLALAVMLSCCVLPVFATIYENFYDTYKTYVYINESVQPYHLAVGKGGDFAFRDKDNTYFNGFFADEFFINTIYRDSSGNINGIQFSFANYTHHKIEVNSGSSFILYDYNLVEDSFTHNYNSKYLYKFDWSKFSVSMSCDIEKGDSFTYLNYQGEEETITFDGQGGIVGYTEPDNPLDDLYEQEYPDFSLPTYESVNFDDYFDFDSIWQRIEDGNVFQVIKEIYSFLGIGFRYMADSVINAIRYLSSVLTALFNWLKSTLPVLFNNFLVSLSPFFEMLKVAITSNPIGEFVFDQDGLFGKLDDILNGTKSIKEVFNESFINALLIIPNFKESVDVFLKTMEEVLKGLWDDITDFFKLFDKTTIDALKNIPKQIMDLPDSIKTFFSTFLISDEEDYTKYLSKKHDSFMTLFYTKFPILEMPAKIKIAVESIQKGNTAIFTFSDVTFPLFNGKSFTIKGFKVEIDIVKKIRTFTDPIILGIAYLSTINFCKNEIPNLIGGVGAGVHQVGDSISQSIHNERLKK